MTGAFPTAERRHHPVRIVGQSRHYGSAGPRRAAPPPRGGVNRRGPSGRGPLFHAPSFSIGLILGAAVVLITGYLPELLAPPPATPAGTVHATSADDAAPPAEVRFEFDTILRTTPAPVARTDGAQSATGRQPPSAVIGESESSTPGILDSATVTSAPTPSNEADATSPTPRPSIPIREPGQPVPTEAEPPGPAGRERSPAAAPVPRPDDGYMLQAASFQSRADADRLRAELLLLDLPANTVAVTVGDAIRYRVTVGPFSDQASTDAAQQRLRERNLTPIPFRG